MNSVQVRIADWQQDNAELRRIREAVFIAEQAVPPEQEWDADDAGAYVIRARSFAAGQTEAYALTVERKP